MRKLISLALVLVMLLAVCGVSALAADSKSDVVEVVGNGQGENGESYTVNVEDVDWNQENESGQTIPPLTETVAAADIQNGKEPESVQASDLMVLWQKELVFPEGAFDNGNTVSLTLKVTGFDIKAGQTIYLFHFNEADGVWEWEEMDKSQYNADGTVTVNVTAASPFALVLKNESETTDDGGNTTPSDTGKNTTTPTGTGSKSPASVGTSAGNGSVSPKTGEGSTLAILCGIVLLASAAAVAVYRKKA